MTLRLGMVGAGGMGMRHANGYYELQNQFPDSFRLAAICDLHIAAAESVCAEVERTSGHRPRAYENFDQMLAEAKLDALDIVTDTRMHHSLASTAFAAGVHVMTEKPMAVTVRACNLMRQAAEKHGRVLSVAENYRRDPMNRLARALLEAGAIGQPQMVVRASLSGGSTLMHNTGWRALKSRAGSIIIEQGVHDADLMMFFLGDFESVYAETALFARERSRAEMHANLARFYSHRVEDQFAGQQAVTVDQEDSAFAVIRFANGAIGQFTMSNAARGHSVSMDTIHGSRGAMVPPPSRTGRPPVIRYEGREQPLTGDEMLALVPDWQLDDITAPFWGGRRRIASYEMPFAEIDGKLIAIEYQELYEAIVYGRPVEVDANVGTKALAFAYAALESGASGLPVKLADVLEGRVDAYQSEVNRANGI